MKQRNFRELTFFFPLFWSLQIKRCWSAYWSARQQREGLSTTEATGTALTVFKFVSGKMQWLYNLNTHSKVNVSVSLITKERQKINLEIREQHCKQKNHRHHLRKLKLNVHSDRTLIHTTKPCKDRFGISILGKWRLPYPRVDISREPVLISKGPLYDKPYLFRGCVYIPFIASTSPVHHTIPNKYPAHASWMNAWTLLE